MMAGRLGPRKAISSKPVLRDGNRVYLGTAERCLPGLAHQPGQLLIASRRRPREVRAVVPEGYEFAS